MATHSNLKNQKMRRTNMKKHRKQLKKERANRKRKRLIVVDSREPKELIDKLKESTDAEVLVLDELEVIEPVSPARRAFQDV